MTILYSLKLSLIDEGFIIAPNISVQDYSTPIKCTIPKKKGSKIDENL